MTFDDVREIVAGLPGMEEGPCYGTPAFRMRKRLVARLKEDGETLVLKMGLDEREMLMEADPKVFFITDHYRNSRFVLVRLKKVRRATLERLIAQAWRDAAPKRVRDEHAKASR
jgi:hypothetical protein